jgi:hypothetical protein
MTALRLLGLLSRTQKYDSVALAARALSSHALAPALPPNPT